MKPINIIGIFKPEKSDYFQIRKYNLFRPGFNNSPQAFTLIELITVVGIIAVLISVSIPAYNILNKRSRMNNATSQVQAFISQTRQTAIVSRQRVGFAIPVSIVRPNNYIRSNMLNRTMLIMSEEAGLSAHEQQVFGKVEPLPKGIIFNPSTYSDWNEQRFIDNSGTVLFTARYFRFTGTGSIYMGDLNKMLSVGKNHFDLSLMEGDVSEDGTWTTNNQAATTALTINLINGRVES